MPRGGTRQGVPGATYTNRSDLNESRQPVRAATGQPYGERKQQVEAQRVNPLPQQASPPQVVPIDAPSQRPDEPVTAGLPFGPGPGPEALGVPAVQPDDDIGIQLRNLYRQYPNNDLLALIEVLDEMGR